MLTQNRIWDVPTVPLGLMNGARGVIVAILYAAPGAGRVDGSRLAGDGYPGSASGHFPRGLQACPLPELVVVVLLSHLRARYGHPCSRKTVQECRPRVGWEMHDHKIR